MNSHGYFGYHIFYCMYQSFRKAGMTVKGLFYSSLRNEPPHDKTKMIVHPAKIQISLGIRPV